MSTRTIQSSHIVSAQPWLIAGFVAFVVRIFSSVQGLGSPNADVLAMYLFVGLALGLTGTRGIVAVFKNPERSRVQTVIAAVTFVISTGIMMLFGYLIWRDVLK